MLEVVTNAVAKVDTMVEEEVNEIDKPIAKHVAINNNKHIDNAISILLIRLLLIFSFIR